MSAEAPETGPQDAGSGRKLSRRTFLITTAATGGALTIALLLPRMRGKSARPGKPAEVGPWLTIDADSNVLLRVPMHESGNGAMTLAALLMAEELRADWSKVRAEPIELNRDARENNLYAAIDGKLSTFSGRSTTPDTLRTLRQVGASARERLKAAAAREWDVPVTEVEARDSVLTHVPTGRTLRYGEIAAAAASVKLDR
ncbi:MAG TPA: molybdopterin cofactor-binding domain-containing protein, partial [Povalibacter sp.]|nr:molybdopterin cofactor-binding domain-containing protein [Povalibacter sp.]